MVKLVNRAKMTTSTQGTGTITLGSAVDGFQTFAAAGVSNGETVRYCIEDGTSNFELGSGVFTASGTTLTRVVSESSNSNNAINLSGDAIVFITAIAADLQPTTFTTTVFTATANQTTFSVSYTVGFAEVFLNGSKLSAADFTATNGTSIVLASGATVGDTVDVVAYATQTIANVYTQSQSDARYLQLTGGTLSGDLTGTTSTFSGDVTIADKIVHSGDTNTAIRFPAVDTFTVETDGSERMRIASTGAATFNGTVTANAGLVVDNITIDGTEIDLSSGDLTIDVAGDIILDADDNGSVKLLDGGTYYGLLRRDNNDFQLYSIVQDGDMVFRGNDGGSNVTALTLDMSAAGAATFNGTVTANAGVTVDELTIDADTITATDDFRVDAAADITLDADGGYINFFDGGTAILSFANSSTDAVIQSRASDRDMIFKGNDGGSTITALTLDMSAAGAATFNSTISDADGKIRAIPQSGSDKTSSYTLTTSDVGNFIGIGSSGSITVPNSTFAAGDAISIFNNTSGDRTITLSITTAYIAGDNTDKNSVTLATRGVCTILFISGTVCVLTGNVS